MSNRRTPPAMTRSKRSQRHSIYASETSACTTRTAHACGSPTARPRPASDTSRSPPRCELSCLTTVSRRPNAATQPPRHTVLLHREGHALGRGQRPTEHLCAGRRASKRKPGQERAAAPTARDSTLATTNLRVDHAARHQLRHPIRSESGRPRERENDARRLQPTTRPQQARPRHSIRRAPRIGTHHPLQATSAGSGDELIPGPGRSVIDGGILSAAQRRSQPTGPADH
jgi:hypothetical protein